MNKMLRSSVIATAMMLSLAAQSSAMEYSNTQKISQFGYDQSMFQKTQPVRKLTSEQQAKKEATFKKVMKILERTKDQLTEKQFEETVNGHQKTYFDLVSEESKAEYGLLVTGLRAEIKEKNIQKLEKEIQQEKLKLGQQEKLMEGKTLTEQQRQALDKKVAAFNQKVEQLEEHFQTEKEGLDLIREDQKELQKQVSNNLENKSNDLGAEIVQLKTQLEEQLKQTQKADSKIASQIAAKIAQLEKQFEEVKKQKSEIDQKRGQFAEFGEQEVELTDMNQGQPVRLLQAPFQTQQVENQVEIQDLRGMIQNLQSKNLNFIEENAELKAHLQLKDQEIAFLKTQLQKLQFENQQLEGLHQELETQIEKLSTEYELSNQQLSERIKLLEQEKQTQNLDLQLKNQKLQEQLAEKDKQFQTQGQQLQQLQAEKEAAEKKQQKGSGQ